ncbi:unnamed protein product [Porites lobata]|uniref:CUB domain-containing protein n=1 Tax=Porites lobata TaxID=104759 RepID=A0ABN8R8B2_9CNID|nr:unnamed protein product [Porites lobata]
MKLVFVLSLMLCYSSAQSADSRCGSVVNNALTSPGFPTQYPNNMHCVQRFHSIRKGAEDQFFNFFPGTTYSMRV